MIESLVGKIGNFIDHQYVKANEFFVVKDPGRLTEEVAEVALGSKETVDKAVTSAYNAFSSWKNTRLAQRIELVNEAALILEKSTDSLSKVLLRENGSVMNEANADFVRGAGILRNMSQRAQKVFEPTWIEDEQHWMSIEKDPMGVIGLIVPWNSPIILTMSKLAPALLAGNTVVVKPSPDAPVALTLALKEIATVFPPGVINIVNGKSEVGKALTEHPLIRKISFTGGVSTGTTVMKNAASTIKNISLELGGNDPAIILDDADINQIMPRLCKGIFTRAGQICFAVKRVYVPEQIIDRFYDVMCQIVDEYHVGHGFYEKSTFGPLINQNQFDYVQGLLDKTKQTNALVRQLGKKVDPGQWDNGYYMLPNIVRDIEPTADLVVLEQFGPIIPLITYKSIDEVVNMANATEFGLCSSVWSMDQDRALKVAQQIEAGGTFINSHNIDSLSLEMPFGGVKQSGIGRERTDIGFSDYFEYHTIRMLKSGN